MASLGPTVFEAARARINEINKEIEKLQSERHECTVRMTQQGSITMLESERVATKAEDLQRNQLPE